MLSAPPQPLEELTHTGSGDTGLPKFGGAQGCFAYVMSNATASRLTIDRNCRHQP